MKSYALSFIILAQSALGSNYAQVESYVGEGFYDGFAFKTIEDPSGGRVNYVNKTTAQNKGLVSTSSDTFVLSADSTTVLNASGPGRNSFRIQSNNQYSTHAIVMDIRHMPEGCGTWPAIWEIGSSFPTNGEFDIVEGANDNGANKVTLHTTDNCTMPATRNMTGYSLGDDCFIGTNETSGCTVKAQDGPGSYGPSFNSAGGGWYAAERTPDFFSVWFWPRDSSTVPNDVSNSVQNVDTSNWGTPAANFPNTNCDFQTHFGPHNIIIDLDLCGSYASSVYDTSGCPGSCDDYVNENPSAFVNAYFDFASMRIYE